MTKTFPTRFGSFHAVVCKPLKTLSTWFVHVVTTWNEFSIRLSVSY